MPTNVDQSLFSRQREKLVEHLFIGELWRALWVSGARDTEVLSPQTDDAGYDVVIQSGRVVRHIQLKTSRRGGKARGQKVHLRLADKPGGCVVWILVNEQTMELGPYLWFGGRPGEALPSLEGLKVAKHTKADAKGHKGERADHRVIPKGRFEPIAPFGDLVVRLFGTAAGDADPHRGLPARGPRSRSTGPA